MVLQGLIDLGAAARPGGPNSPTPMFLITVVATGLLTPPEAIKIALVVNCDHF